MIWNEVFPYILTWTFCNACLQDCFISKLRSSEKPLTTPTFLCWHYAFHNHQEEGRCVLTSVFSCIFSHVSGLWYKENYCSKSSEQLHPFNSLRSDLFLYCYFTRDYCRRTSCNITQLSACEVLLLSSATWIAVIAVGFVTFSLWFWCFKEGAETWEDEVGRRVSSHATPLLHHPADFRSDSHFLSYWSLDSSILFRKHQW